MTDNGEDVTQRTIASAVKVILEALGEDVNREGLLKTPARVADALIELSTPQGFEFTTFNAEGMSEMIVEAPISFHSLCEHHMMSFFGKAAVGYIPNGKIVGLSKLPRAVEYCSKGLQNQERITLNIADMVEKALKPLGVGVILRGRHMCMEARGVHAAGVFSTTSRLTGVMMEPAVRAEFLRLVGGSLE